MPGNVVGSSSGRTNRDCRWERDLIYLFLADRIRFLEIALIGHTWSLDSEKSYVECLV